MITGSIKDSASVRLELKTLRSLHGECETGPVVFKVFLEVKLTLDFHPGDRLCVPFSSRSLWSFPEPNATLFCAFQEVIQFGIAWKNILNFWTLLRVC